MSKDVTTSGTSTRRAIAWSALAAIVGLACAPLEQNDTWSPAFPDPQRPGISRVERRQLECRTVTTRHSLEKKTSDPHLSTHGMVIQTMLGIASPVLVAGGALALTDRDEETRKANHAVGVAFVGVGIVTTTFFIANIVRTRRSEEIIAQPTSVDVSRWEPCAIQPTADEPAMPETTRLCIRKCSESGPAERERVLCEEKCR
jgi:hypothetical protein